MTGVIIVAVLLLVLYKKGRLGPLAWEGREQLVRGRHPGELGGRPFGPSWAHHYGPDGALAQRRETPEEVLARRLADGDLSPDEYLERSALLHER